MTRESPACTTTRTKTTSGRRFGRVLALNLGLLLATAFALARGAVPAARGRARRAQIDEESNVFDGPGPSPGSGPGPGPGFGIPGSKHPREHDHDHDHGPKGPNGDGGSNRQGPDGESLSGGKGSDGSMSSTVKKEGDSGPKYKCLPGTENGPAAKKLTKAPSTTLPTKRPSGPGGRDRFLLRGYEPDLPIPPSVDGGSSVILAPGPSPVVLRRNGRNQRQRRRRRFLQDTTDFSLIDEAEYTLMTPVGGPKPRIPCDEKAPDECVQEHCLEYNCLSTKYAWVDCHTPWPTATPYAGDEGGGGDEDGAGDSIVTDERVGLNVPTAAPPLVEDPTSAPPDPDCGEGILCTSGACCSEFGFCGYTDKHCGGGCTSNCDATEEDVTSAATVGPGGQDAADGSSGDANNNDAGTGAIPGATSDGVDDGDDGIETSGNAGEATNGDTDGTGTNDNPGIVDNGDDGNDDGTENHGETFNGGDGNDDGSHGGTGGSSGGSPAGTTAAPGKVEPKDDRGDGSNPSTVGTVSTSVPTDGKTEGSDADVAGGVQDNDNSAGSGGPKNDDGGTDEDKVTGPGLDMDSESGGDDSSNGIPRDDIPPSSNGTVTQDTGNSSAADSTNNDTTNGTNSTSMGYDGNNVSDTSYDTNGTTTGSGGSNDADTSDSANGTTTGSDGNIITNKTSTGSDGDDATSGTSAESDGIDGTEIGANGTSTGSNSKEVTNGASAGTNVTDGAGDANGTSTGSNGDDDTNGNSTESDGIDATETGANGTSTGSDGKKATNGTSAGNDGTDVAGGANGTSSGSDGNDATNGTATGSNSNDGGSNGDSTGSDGGGGTDSTDVNNGTSTGTSGSDGTIASNSSNDTGASDSVKSNGVPAVGGQSPRCDDVADGVVFQTGLSLNVSFRYELAYDQTKDVSDVAADLDEAIRSFLSRRLINCIEENPENNGGRRERVLWISRSAPSVIVGVLVGPARRSTITIRKGGRKMPVDGVGAGESSVVPNMGCSGTEYDNEVGSCAVIDSAAVLYLREDTPETSEAQSATTALQELRQGMNEGDDFVDTETGVLNVTFLGAPPGSAAGGGGIITKESEGGGIGAAGAVRSIDNGDDSLSPLGISLITVAAVGVVLLAVLLIRKKRSVKASTEERYVEDDVFSDPDKDFGKMPLSPVGTDSTAEALSSPRNVACPPSPKSSWRKSRAAHVLSDDADSIYTSPFANNTPPSEATSGSSSDSEQHNARLSPEVYDGPDVSDLGGHHSGINVHACTSATCDICGGKGVAAAPRFVPSTDAGDDSTVEGFSDVSGSVSRTPSRPRASTNGLGGVDFAKRRAYPMQDTVDF